MSFEWIAIILAWVAITVLAFGYAGVLRALGDLAAVVDRPIRALLIGKRAPSIRTYSEYPSETVLLFASDDCLTCNEVVPRFDQLVGSRNGTHTEGVVVFRSIGESELLRGVATRVVDAKAFDAFAVDLVPTAIHIAEGRIRAVEPIGSVRQIESFVEMARNSSNHERSSQ